MRQHGLAGLVSLLVCFAAVLPAVTGYWFRPNMDGDMERLLGRHGLQAAVQYLDAEGVWDLNGLRIIEESDVDSMAQRRNIPWITVKLLKSKIRDKVLVVELEQEKAQQVKENAQQLIEASTKGQTDEVDKIITTLISVGAKLDLQDKDGYSALMLGSKKGHAEVAGKLIAAKANLDLQKEYGWTALMIASQNGHAEVVGKLIAAKADLDLQDTDGWTALMLASVYGRAEVAGKLIAAKANLDLQITNGRTALDLAKQKGHSEIEALLRAKGAKQKEEL